MRETKRPRSVQTILRMIIRLGRYGADNWDEQAKEYACQHYMCLAAGVARDNHEITPEEYERVYSAIGAYLGTYGTLRGSLRGAGLVSDMTGDAFASTVGCELYWNWNKRPDLTPKP